MNKMAKYGVRTNPNIGNNLRKRRTFKRLRQQDIADIIGVSIQIYRQIELNQRRMKLTEQKKLANFFEVSEIQLYDIEEE